MRSPPECVRDAFIVWILQDDHGLGREDRTLHALSDAGFTGPLQHQLPTELARMVGVEPTTQVLEAFVLRLRSSPWIKSL